MPAPQWLALTQLYELDFEGLPADDARGLSYDRIPSAPLEQLRGQGLVIGSPVDAALPAEKYTITHQGRAFYYQHYRVNALAHRRGHELPRPVLTAEHRAFWQRQQELSEQKDQTRGVGATNQRAHEAIRRAMLQRQIAAPLHTLYVAPCWYVALAGRGIQLAPNIAMEDSHVETEAEAVTAGQQLVERWKLQLSWLEPAS